MSRFSLLLLCLLPLGGCAHSGAAASSPVGGTDQPRSLGRGQEWLAPGRYTRDEFLPRIVFEVGPGWTAEQVAPGFFDVQRDVGTPDVIAVQFANVLGGRSAAEVLEQLHARPYLRVGATERVRVGGREGVRIVVETTDAPGAEPPVFREVLRVPAGPISIASGRRLQVTLVDTAHGVLGVLVGGSISQWQRTLAEAEPIVASARVRVPPLFPEHP